MIYLYENKNIDKTLESYTTLETHIVNTKSLHPYFEINFQGIKPKNYCEFLSVEGESYFMKIQNDDDLEFVLEYKIKPLLEEYYCGDENGLNDILDLIMSYQ